MASADTQAANAAEEDAVIAEENRIIDQNLEQIKRELARPGITAQAVATLKQEAYNEQQKRFSPEEQRARAREVLQRRRNETAVASIDPPDLKNTLADPAVPGPVKNQSIASALQTPELQEFLTDGILNTKARTDSRVAQTLDSMSKMDDALGEQAFLVKNQAELEKQKIYLAQQRDAQNKMEYDRHLSTLGINLSDLDNLAAQKGAENIRLHNDLRAIRGRYNELQGISFLDDPFSWLNAQFEMGDVVRQHNQIAREFNSNEALIKTQADLAKSVRDANVGKAATLSAQEAEVAAQLVANEANRKVAEIQGKRAEIEGRKVDSAIKIEDQAVGKLLTFNQVVEQQKANEEARQQRLAVARDAEERRRLEAEIRAERAEGQKKIDSFYANGMAAAGYPGITTQKQFEQLDKKRQKQLEPIIMSNGERWGDNLQDSIENFQAANKQGLPREQVRMMGIASSIYQEALNDPALKAQANGKQEELRKLAAAKVAEKFKDWANDPKEGGPKINGTPYRLYSTLPIEEVAKTPSMVGNKFSQMIISARAANPSIPEVTPEMALYAVADKVAAKEMNISEAAKAVTNFYRFAGENTNSAMQFEKYGLPKQESYPVTMGTGFFGGDQKHNLMNVASVEKMLLKMIAKRNNFSGEEIFSGALGN